MNKHSYYHELVNLKIDDSLSAAQGTELSAHLETCADCAELIKVYSLIHDLSDSMLVEPPENFTSSVMYKISRNNKPIPFKKYFPRVISLVGAAAVVSLVIWGNAKGFFGFNMNMSDSAAPPAMKSAMVADDADVSGSQTSEEEGPAYGSSSTPSEHNDIASAPELFSTDKESLDSNLFDPSLAEPGDVVAGFTLTSNATTYTENIPETVVEFTGEATLSGILSFENNDDGFWGKFAYFTIDDDCFELLPYATNDTRTVWFGFTNQDYALEHLEIHPDDAGNTINFRAMITIDSYSIYLGSTDGCNFASLKDVHFIERIY